MKYRYNIFNFYFILNFQVYTQLKKIIIKLILAYPQHCLWMMMCVIKSSYTQRVSRWNDIMKDPRLLEAKMFKFISDFKQLAEKLMELCNKPIGDNVHVTQVSTLMRTFPRLLASENFSQIIMPHEKFIKVTLPRETIAKVCIRFIELKLLGLICLLL